MKKVGISNEKAGEAGMMMSSGFDEQTLEKIVSYVLSL